MKLTTIEARDLNEAWFLCLKEAMNNGREYTIDRGSNVGHKRKEIDFITLQVVYPGTRPLEPDVPVGIPAPTSQDYINNYMSYLMTGQRKIGEQYTYGQYLAPQIPKIIEMYKQDGYGTNQAYMAIGDMNSVDLPDPPCLRGVDTRISDGHFHFCVYFRSWDLWAGFPSNLAGLQILKEYMASEIGVEDGELIACSKGLHLYDYSWDLAKAVVNR